MRADQPITLHLTELDEALIIIFELMGDSVLLPFLECLLPIETDEVAEDYDLEFRQGRLRFRIMGITPPRPAQFGH